jgi:ribosomal protein S18 acetylase RimI-like enzyme
VGRGLRVSALNWLFGTRAVPLVGLTVREGSAPALGLYEAAGFTRVATGAKRALDQLSTTAGVANSRPTTARA